MAIKKRPPVDPSREAEIEAFGAAAELAAEPGRVRQAKAPARTVVAQRSAPRPRPAGKKGDLKPMLIRFDVYEHELLREVAEMEGRSMHNMAKTALIPALEAIREARRQ